MTELTIIIKEEIEENLKDYIGCYFCDIAHEMYNRDYYIIGTYQAKEKIKEHIEDILATLEQYHFEFGTHYTEITDYEKLITLTVYTIAQNIINKITPYNQEFLTEENLPTVLKDLQNIKTLDY